MRRGEKKRHRTPEEGAQIAKTQAMTARPGIGLPS